MADSTPQNLTVGQAEQILEGLPQDAVALEYKLAPIVQKIVSEISKDAPGSKATLDSLAMKLYDLEKGINANAQAVSNLTNQVAPFTGLFQGIPLKGSGQIMNTLQSIPEGLKTTMTHEQRALHIIAGVLQAVFIIGGLVLTFFPNIGGLGIGAGLTLAGAMQALKNLIEPFLTEYGDSNLQSQLVPTAAPVNQNS